MFISVIILICLSISVSFLSFSLINKRLKERIDKPDPEKRRFNFRPSLVATLDHLLAAVLVFTLSVMVSSYVYRSTTHSRFDALMADVLSMFSSTAAVMICASYWAISKPRVYVTISMFVVVVLDIVLFATHFNIFYKPGMAVERLCSRGYGSMTPNERFHRSYDFYFLLGGFTCWCLAVFGAVFHHPRLRPFRPLGGWPYACWVVVEALPSIAGTVALGIYSLYFWQTREIMQDGGAFNAAIKKWGFGQYLAVATWFPPILHFFYYYLGKPGRSLERLLG
jgi:hypothetical protein